MSKIDEMIENTQHTTECFDKTYTDFQLGRKYEAEIILDNLKKLRPYIELAEMIVKSAENGVIYSTNHKKYIKLIQ